MQSKIDELTKKLYEEGVQKAQQDANTILNNAENKAKEIISHAEVEALNITEKAQIEAKNVHHKAEQEIKQLFEQSKDLLKDEISELITVKIAKSELKETFDNSSFIKNIIQTMFKNWNNTSDNTNTLTVLLSEEQASELTDFFKAEALKHLKIGIQNQGTSGFSIINNHDNYHIEFSEISFSNFFKKFLKPHIREFLFKEDNL